jgi:hypothetical protein
MPLSNLEKCRYTNAAVLEFDTTLGSLGDALELLSATSRLDLIIIHALAVDRIFRNRNRPHIANHVYDSNAKCLTPSP